MDYLIDVSYKGKILSERKSGDFDSMEMIFVHIYLSIYDYLNDSTQKVLESK